MSVKAPRGPRRRIFLDLTPLRRSRDYRALIAGLGVSVLGNQLTTVAVPFQVYAITRSSLVVGLVSLAQLFPLIIGSLLGGSMVDAVDRRKILIVVETIGALCSAALALNADLGPQLWPLFLFPAITASIGSICATGSWGSTAATISRISRSIWSGFAVRTRSEAANQKFVISLKLSSTCAWGT